MKPSFAARLIDWQRLHGRHDLPWQVADPYFVWLSEVMLQQTQVATVIPYFQAFVARFPDVHALAAAPVDEVMAAWSGLGYYSRARNLHRAAGKVVHDWQGRFPPAQTDLMALPGVGRSTAAAIAAFCFGARTAILDGNVKRVLTRWAGIDGWPGERVTEARLWSLAESLLPEQELPAYTQGLMDLGSTVCTRSKPRCDACPLADDCVARHENRQARLPSPKPRKTLPEKHVVLLLIRHESHILLERRPPTGIWGGLWSLPEAPDTLSVATMCRQRYGLEVEFDPPQDDFVHVFTHFRLTITPLPGHAAAMLAVQDLPFEWHSLESALTLGLPAPVRRLLQAV